MEGGGYTVVSWFSEATTFFFLPALSDLLSSFFSLLLANSDAFIHVLILCFLTGSTAVIARAASFTIMPQRVGNGSCLVASTYYCTCVHQSSGTQDTTVTCLHAYIACRYDKPINQRWQDTHET